MKIVPEDDEYKELQILKKYEMQRFASQESTEEVIRDFGNIVYEQTGIRIFKDNFYK